MRSKRHAGANQLRRTQTHSGAVSQGRTSAGLLSGVLSKEELDAGHGMHMSVSTSKRRQKALLDSSSNDVDSNMGAGGGEAPSEGRLCTRSPLATSPPSSVRIPPWRGANLCCREARPSRCPTSSMCFRVATRELRRAWEEVSFYLRMTDSSLS